MRCLLCNQWIVTDLTLLDWLSLNRLQQTPLCASCRRRFEKIGPQFCPGCGRANEGELCDDCVRWQARGETLLRHRAVYRYNAWMKSVIAIYKRSGDFRLAAIFRGDLQLDARHSALVPLTTEPQHYQQRHFDPVLGLFGHLPLSLWLKKRDTDHPQAEKTRAERLRTKQSFSAILPASPPAKVLLLDDLYTTGRTLYHAATALREAGYMGEIRSFSLIR